MKNPRELTSIRERDLRSCRLKEIPDKQANIELERCVNLIYAMLALNDTAKLMPEELSVFKTLVREKFRNISTGYVLEAFKWGLMQEALEVKRLDFKTFSRVIKRYGAYLCHRRKNQPQKQEQPVALVGYTLDKKKALEGYYQDWKKGKDPSFFALKTGCFDYLKSRYDIAQQIISQAQAIEKAKAFLKEDLQKERQIARDNQKKREVKQLSGQLENMRFSKRDLHTRIKQVVIIEYFKKRRQHEKKERLSDGKSTCRSGHAKENHLCRL